MAVALLHVLQYFELISPSLVIPVIDMTWMWLFLRCWIWQGPHCQYCRVTCSLGQDFQTCSAFFSGKFISLTPCTSSNLFRKTYFFPDIRDLMKEKINSNYHSPGIKPPYLGSKCLELEASSYIWGSSLSYTSHFCQQFISQTTQITISQ